MTALAQALSVPDASIRLRAAMTAGTAPNSTHIGPLVDRLGAEPDFFVRDMLTWALTRYPTQETLTELLPQLCSDNPQARSQTLHTLSKIGDQAAYASISTDLLHDADNDVARTAWRAATGLVPEGKEQALAEELVTELGACDEETRRSLSRALTELGETARPLFERIYPNEEEQAHARATLALLDNPSLDFTHTMQQARRHHNTGALPE